jgi:hypothetical protein
MTRTAFKPQPVLALGAALTLCGTIMGRKVRTRTDLRTNLYIIGVADSGAGKEHQRHAVKTLLNEANGFSMITQDLASGPGLFEAVHKSPSHLLLVDEVGRFLMAITKEKAAPHMIEVQTMLMRFTGEANSIFADKSRAENRDAEPRSIVNPNLSMYGTTVPGRLFQGLRKDDITDGFLPRILCFHSDDPDPDDQGSPNKVPDAGMVRRIGDWIRRPTNAYPTGNNIADIKPNPLWVDATPDAGAVFDRFKGENRKRKAQTRGTGIDAMWARADEHAWRLALIVACGCSFENPVIDREHAEWACAVVQFVLDRAIVEIELNVGDSAHELTVKKLLAYFKKERTVDRSQLSRRFQDLREPELHSALDTLRHSGRISDPRVIPAGTKGGRPKTEWSYLG